ncbi:MAG: methylenetetrahydrofolate reductase [Chloroflexi bacterium]|nr:methylenetetrahydrofolate reductase [Chloroflexota bacterium]
MPRDHPSYPPLVSALCRPPVRGARVPDWFARLFDGLDDGPQTRQCVAATIAAEQCRGLQVEGVGSFHFYTLNRSTSTRDIFENLKAAGALA